MYKDGCFWARQLEMINELQMEGKEIKTNKATINYFRNKNV